MSMAPGGSKYTPKAENIPISTSDNPMSASMAAIVGGIAIAQLGGLPLWGYCIAAIGGIGTVSEFIRLADPWEKLFERLNITIDGETPRKKSRRITDYGYCISFSLPTGLSTDDFEKKRKAIEQYLNKRIDISYKNYRVYIRVFEKELDESPEYRFIETKNPLEFAVGIEYGNQVVTVDLDKVVHLLVGGETGSGKSTVLRVILTNLIKDKRNITFHLIDLKNGTEFNVFRKCKQVKSFSRSIEEAEIVLSKLLEEVDRRYELFYENDVVDIKEYNKLKGKRKLHYQICVIDEFADLQDEKGSILAIETLVAKARACGIHLIISTQRPDAKILNGRIKANVPGVIGLKTMNSLNSRIIIDEDGLEKLRGKGHGLFRNGNLIEFQSMFLNNKQARDLVKHTYIEKTDKKTEDKMGGKVVDMDFVKNLRGD